MSAGGAARGAAADPGPFERVTVETGARSRMAALVRALVSLGYRRIRCRRDARATFDAVDEQRIATVIIVDVAPLEGGYPVPRISPARATGLREVCVEYLLDHVRTRRVRADYIALPDGGWCGGELPLTQCRGVAWAYANDRHAAST